MPALQQNAADRMPWLVRLGYTMQRYVFRSIQLLLTAGNLAIDLYVLFVSILSWARCSRQGKVHACLQL